MKCINCMYEKDCELKKIAKDLTGCEGHSKAKIHKEKVKCFCCNKLVKNEHAFLHKIYNKHLCFKCY